MASLGKFIHRERNQNTGEILDFSGPVTVSKDGIFRIVVENPDLAAVISANHSASTYLNEGAKFLGICGYDLEAIKNDIKRGMKSFLRSSVVTEYVIKYAIDSRWAAWVNPETGEFWGCGGIPGCATRPPADWDGQGSVNSRSPACSFSFAVGAQVYKKITNTRGEHSKSVYYRVHGVEDAEHIGEYGKELATYTLWHDKEERNVVEIPYTEERAKFFLELVKAIVKLGLLTKPYLRDVASVEKAIEQHAAGQLRLPGGER